MLAGSIYEVESAPTGAGVAVPSGVGFAGVALAAAGARTSKAGIVTWGAQVPSAVVAGVADAGGSRGRIGTVGVTNLTNSIDEIVSTPADTSRAIPSGIDAGRGTDSVDWTA